MAVGMSVEVSGPLFKEGGRIVGKVTEQFVQRMVELGEQRLDIVLRPRDTKLGVYLTVAQAKGRGFLPSQGNYRRNVHGTPQGLRARIDDSGVVYGPWLEFGGGRFKGYAAFRKTKQWLDGEVDKEARDYMKNYVRRLGG
tara:strand:+ start:30 stop:449 length:420 start_codon:yes stop_codon:yes gene_type:complete